MPVYDFSGNDGLGAPVAPLEQLVPLEQPIVHAPPPGQLQLDHVAPRYHDLGRQVQQDPSWVEEFAMPGFKALDDAMRRYWSGIRVPTKDSYRYLRIKVAGMDKSLAVWNDDLKGGRVRLPVAALDRSSHEFNAEKYSPASHPMALKYASRRGDKAIKVFRPVPFLVEYKLIVWTERKRDMEHILYQVLTRYNPMAEFRMFDGHLVGNVQLRYGGAIDTSDKEIGHDQHANVRYEVSTTAEAWLPLPEQVCKTVLGKVSLLQERSGAVLEANRGYQQWFTPEAGV